MIANHFGDSSMLLECMYSVTSGSTLEMCNTLKWLYKNISKTVTVSPVLSALAVTRRNQWRSKTHGLTLTGVTQHVRRISGELYLGPASLWDTILHGGASPESRNSVICHYDSRRVVTRTLETWGWFLGHWENLLLNLNCICVHSHFWILEDSQTVCVSFASLMWSVLPISTCRIPLSTYMRYFYSCT